MQFGGFSGLCIRLVAWIIAKSSKFALDNSMIKKLYSAEADEEEKKKKANSVDK